MIEKKVGRPANFSVSDDTKMKQSKALTGHNVSQTTREKISKSMIGNRNAVKSDNNLADDLLNEYSDISPEIDKWLSDNYDELNNQCNIKTSKELNNCGYKEVGMNLYNLNNLESSDIIGINPIDLMVVKEEVYGND